MSGPTPPSRISGQPSSYLSPSATPSLHFSNNSDSFIAMASDAAAGSRVELFDSAVTVPSDSENYSANNEMTSTQSESPSSSSGTPMILYQPPSIWGLLRGAAINLILPFVNGLMLGFGELFAHEAAFRLGWSNTKVCCTELYSYTHVFNY